MIIMYYIALLAKFGNCCSIVWAYRPMKGQELWYFLFGGGAKKLHVVLQCIFERDFLSPRTTKVSGIEKYPSASMSCCSDDLAQWLPCVDL